MRLSTAINRGSVVANATPKVPPAWPGRAEAPSGYKNRTTPKPISLLGSTGSIGTQTLDICGEFSEQFDVVGLAAGRNITLLAEQIKKFQPKIVSIQSAEDIKPLQELIKDVPQQPELVVGVDGNCAVASHPDIESVVTGIVGCAGLKPTCAAIEAGKNICLANKETLIAGGPAVLPLAEKHNVKILPADSEHSALFQCIQGLPEDGLRRIILTASGGAFRDWDVSRLKDVTVADACSHPNWSMGRKITVDSATLMNKGLEVIEAHYLYGTDYDNIDIVIHPQSIIHSMVETADSSILAQLGWPDMRLPILYTMTWPERFNTSEETWPRLDFIKMGDLTFREPDHEKYPAMQLAYAAGRAGGTMTGVLSAANEKAVELFLEEKISYLEIMKYVGACCEKHKSDHIVEPTLEEIVHFDEWAREWTGRAIEKHTTSWPVAATL